MSELIDYAGLFPPAGLSMRNAVENYARYRQDPHAWMLARFIVPAGRLDEFARVQAEIEDENHGEWRVSVLASASPRDDFRIIQQWNASPQSRFEVDTYEVKVAGAEEITAIEGLAPAELTTYYEFVASKAGELLPAIFEGGGSAKIRTGGVPAPSTATPALDGGSAAGMFPSAATVADFVYRCAQEHVPFKATAGLHHAMRGPYCVTYAVDSPTTLMHGFLNVFLASALAWDGARADEIEALLEERDAAAFKFSDEGIRWRDRMVSTAKIQEARQGFAVAFGSCSFEDPITELHELKLI
jgi:hypothetical protein